MNEEQQSDILDKIVLLNPKAKIVKTVQSKINVMDILDTRLYEANKETEDFWVTASKVAADEKTTIDKWSSQSTKYNNVRPKTTTAHRYPGNKREKGERT